MVGDVLIDFQVFKRNDIEIIEPKEHSILFACKGHRGAQAQSTQPSSGLAFIQTPIDSHCVPNKLWLEHEHRFN